MQVKLIQAIFVKIKTMDKRQFIIKDIKHTNQRLLELKTRLRTKDVHQRIKDLTERLNNLNNQLKNL
jgi:hypothetical protein